MVCPAHLIRGSILLPAMYPTTDTCFADCNKQRTFPAVSHCKSADYKQVPPEFDGNRHYGELRPLRSERRHCGAMSVTTNPPRGLNLPSPKPAIVAVTQQNLRNWWALFVNRKAYTRQSTNPHPDTGRPYHYQPKNKDSGQPLELDPATVRKHLAGRITIGLYAINSQSQRWSISITSPCVSGYPLRERPACETASRSFLVRTGSPLWSVWQCPARPTRSASRQQPPLLVLRCR